MTTQTLNVIEDAHERDNGSNFNDSNTIIRMDDSTSAGGRFNGGFYFELSSAIGSGATVNDAYLILEMSGTAEPDGTLYANDTGDADDFSTTADVTSRTRTTAGTAWSDSGLTGSQNSTSFTSSIQELVDDNSGLASGAGVCILFISASNGSSTFRVESIDDGGGTPADLYIDWTDAGGTEYDQSVAGGISFGGAIVKETAVNYAGGLSFAGGISKLIQVAYAGILSFGGGVSKKTNALYSGGVSFAGSIAKKTLKPLSGGASFVGGLATRLVKLLSLAGGISFNGGVSRKISKVFGGALPLSGVLSRSTGKLLAGVQDFSGNIVKKTAVSYAGVMSFAGSLAARLVKLLSLSGGISFNGDISKLPKKSLAGVASFTGGISKKITRTLQGSLSFAGAIYKKTITTLQGSLSFIGSLAASISSTVTAYTLTLYKRTNILKVKKRTNELNVYERDNDLTIEDNTK